MTIVLVVKPNVNTCKQQLGRTDLEAYGDQACRIAYKQELS